MESKWPLSFRVSACLYYLRRLVLSVVDGANPAFPPLASESASLESGLFGAWSDRWLRGQRYHEEMRQSLLAGMEPLSEEHREERDEVQRVCRGGLAAAALRAVAECETSAHEPRWQRGLVPLIERFRLLQSQARAVDPLATHDVPPPSSGLDAVVDAQHRAIASMLLANYAEWVLAAVIGDGPLVWFMDACMDTRATETPAEL